jgi:hypothetical protein
VAVNPPHTPPSSDWAKAVLFILVVNGEKIKEVASIIIQSFVEGRSFDGMNYKDYQLIKKTLALAP